MYSLIGANYFIEARDLNLFSEANFDLFNYLKFEVMILLINASLYIIMISHPFCQRIISPPTQTKNESLIMEFLPL